jgi:hypothetical protein
VQGIINCWLARTGRPRSSSSWRTRTATATTSPATASSSGKPNTTLVGTSQTAVAAFFGFTSWPNDIVTYDLGGGRVLDVLADPRAPGRAHRGLRPRHGAAAHGDTLYPGFLFISGAVSQGNFAKYQASIQRLVDFTASRPGELGAGHARRDEGRARSRPIPTARTSSRSSATCS